MVVKSIFSESLEDIENWLSLKLDGFERANIILIFSVIVYGVIFSALTITRYNAFQTRAWDFGIFTQSFWTTINNGKLFYYTCELPVNPTGCFFGIHFSPILFLILPFYAAFERPETLLVVQAFIVALAAVPLYKLAKEYAGGRTVGLVFSTAYLLYPAIQFVNWYDFHVQAFLPLFFACTIYYATKKSWTKYFAFVLLSLMCEEHAAIIIFFFGIYIAWKARHFLVSFVKRKGRLNPELLVSFSTMIIGVSWYLFTLWQRNTFFPTNPAALNEFLGSSNFTILGAKDPLQIPYLVILRPLNAIQALLYDSPAKLVYLALLFGPLALFSFKAPSVLVPTIPWFGFSLLSQTMAHHVLGHQYEAYVVAFIFAAAVFAFRKVFLKQGLSKTFRRNLKITMITSVTFFLVFSPMCPLVQTLFPNYASIQIGTRQILLQKVVNRIPSNESVLTQDNLFPQVSSRIDAYVVPERFLNTTIDKLTRDFVRQTLDKVNYVLLDNKTDPIATKLVLSLLQNKPQFKLIDTEDNNTILLFQRKA